MSFLDIALRNAARGFRVFPVHRGTKQPCIKDFPELATAEPGEAWASQFREANCGVIGDDVHLILDTDRWDKLQELFAVQLSIDPALFDTYCVAARDNRRQFAFLQTERSRAMKKRNLDYAVPGEPDNVFEFKSWRKFGMGEGSVHKTGATYTIVQDRPIKPVPDLLIMRAEELAATVKPQRQDGQMEARLIAHGEQHNELVRITGVMRQGGCNPAEILAALEVVAATRCEDDIPHEHLEQIANSAANWPIGTHVSVILTSETAPPQEKKATDWRELFHTREEAENAPPISFLIEGFLQCEGVTGLAAPVRERKSLIALNVAHALVTGEKLFGHFSVVKKPERVLYLCPEMSLGPFSDRLKKIGLLNHVGERLFYRTLSKDGRVTLIDEALKSALPGSVVILDTAVRFISGDEDSSSDMRLFADELFALLRAGAEAVLVLYHSPKSQRNADGMTLENALRGSGDLGAALACCWGTRLQDVSKPYESASYVENLKQRDFESNPFEITSGPDCRMHIVGDPSMRGVKLQPRIGNKSNPDGMDEAAEAFIKANIDRYKTVREMAKQLKEIGITRGTTWIGKVRNRVTGTGCTREAA